MDKKEIILWKVSFQMFVRSKTYSLKYKLVSLIKQNHMEELQFTPREYFLIR